jgi:hypothetical protein
MPGITTTGKREEKYMAEREPIAEQLPTPNNPTITSTITPWATIRDSLAEGGHT